MKKIRLAGYEFRMASQVGLDRWLNSITDGLAQKDGYVRDKDVTIDVEGACAELAAAKALDLYWDGSVNRSDKADLRFDIDVKHTRHEDGRLLISKDDRDDWFYVLVTERPPKMTVHGFMKGSDAKREDWWDHPDPERDGAFCVPQKRLRPLSDLSRIIKEDMP